ncbi:deoxyribodipyrimidine photo-lyase [Salinispirillum sp. LH 10-3-1]|uniref:Deoxyribodipyrimidine photo-lyase n=1 Tax=Salinispirillum sp. LH 10-3-1 TaxID=2952525 RepID=A0AB38YFJ8_9GAMM
MPNVAPVDGINAVWFKRDLRLRDHPALAAACAADRPTLLFYCIEPLYLNDPHYSLPHHRFLVQALADLSAQLRALGHRLVVFWAPIDDVLPLIHRTWGLHTLFSHEEVGLANTYARDRQVAHWCAEQQVRWIELQQLAVQRGQRGRQGWTTFANHFLAEPLAQANLASLKPVAIPETDDWKRLVCSRLPKSWLGTNEAYQPGGEQAAQKRWVDFLQHSASLYRRSISKPAAAADHSSRWSVYLAYGCLSIRDACQQVQQALVSGVAKTSLSALYSRLRWHCHFIQKFEAGSHMEHSAINPVMGEYWAAHWASLSPDSQQERFARWAQGETGYPLVDASMHALLQTGFVNFRMRALLVSVACHHLSLDWRSVAQHLARHFLDFEPGIHYSQVQMQAGLTGFNTLRIYNPLQQSLRKDSEGAFIRRYLPELASLPLHLQHAPWQLSPLEAQWLDTAPPTTYQQRLFDHEETGRAARERLWAWRKDPAVQAHVPALLKNQAVTSA